MLIRDFREKDRATVLEMADSFYHSSAVDHPVPLEHFAAAYSAMCEGGSTYLRGLLMEHEGAVAGYCALAFTYSVEAGGLVVWIEEIFLKPDYRGLGLGKELFAYLKDTYRGKAARLRLEATAANTRAMALYQRLGFSPLPYLQMINEDF